MRPHLILFVKGITKMNRRIGLLLVVAGAMFAFYVSMSATTAQSNISVALETDPTPSQIVPDFDLVHTVITVVGENGQPLENAHLSLTLDSPDGNPILSTDFPFVEGTRLLAANEVLPAGRFEFDYIYPIRGDYDLNVEVTPPGGATFPETLNLTVRENPGELRVLLVFLVILAIFGMLSGWVVGRGARARQLPVSAILLLTCTLVFPLSSVYADQGDDVNTSGGIHNSPEVIELVEDGDVQLMVAMNPGTGTVGRLNDIRLALRLMDSRPLQNVQFDQ